MEHFTNLPNRNPDHPLAILIEQGQQSRLPYLQYYQHLQEIFADTEACEQSLTQRIHDECMIKIRQKAGEDENSRLGVYFQVNPELEPPPHNYKYNLEFERVLITRYRSGSHNLKIESGRLCNPIIPRDERLCSCNTGIQSLHHCLFDCPLLAEVHAEYNYESIEEAFKLPEIANLLMEVEKII